MNKLNFTILNKNDMFDKRDISKACYNIAASNQKHDWSIWHPQFVYMGDIFIIAKTENEIAGFMSLSTDKNYETYEKGALTGVAVAVKPELRNQGIGTQIYDHMIRNSKTFEKYCFNFRRANKVSQNFHKKLGFKEIKHTQSDDFGVHIFDKAKQKTTLIRDSFTNLFKSKDKDSKEI